MTAHPAFVDPRQMPEMRRDLLHLGRPGGEWEAGEQHRAMTEAVGTVAPGKHSGARGSTSIIDGPQGYDGDDIVPMLHAAQQRAENAMRWNRRALVDSQLIHVSSDLCDVLFSSAPSIPDDNVLDLADAPTEYGMALFQTPFIGLDSGDQFEQVRVDAIMWGPVVLPPRDDWMLGVDGVTPALAIAAFRWMDPHGHDDPAALELREAIDAGHMHYGDRAWVPLGRSDWVIGDTVPQPIHDGIDADGRVHASMVEDRRLLAALWSLIAQKRVVDRRRLEPTRQMRRQRERKGHAWDQSVEVVHLRRPEYAPRHADDSTGRKIGVRFVVRPHWRNQAYGPERSLRRLILIPPHVKGPADAPMSNVERVWAIDQ